MTNDIKSDGSTDAAAQKNHAMDEAAADPVAVVLLLHREAGNRQQEDNRISRPLKQAEIKERVLRRMLENSLERSVPAGKPHLKIIK